MPSHHRISVNELQAYIEVAFAGDNDLVHFHVSGDNFANHTYDTIKDALTYLPLQVYRFGEIGFTVLCAQHALLYSFGISPLHRNKETLKKWFDEIKDILIRFDCVLWKKNERAINHLIRQGMTRKNETEDYVILTY